MRHVVARLHLWALEIPMKRRFRHAAAERKVATPLVLALDVRGGATGYGETHARPYVTGETPERVAAVLRDEFVPRLLELRPRSVNDALDLAAALPETDRAGRPITAARALVELALLDAYSRTFGVSLDALAACFRGPSEAPGGSLERVRVSGVVSADGPDAVRRRLFWMRLYGLRDFKVKVGDAGDDARLRAAAAALGASLRRGTRTLRADANAAWTAAQAAERLEQWRDLNLCCVEQPLRPEDDEQVPALAERAGLPLMADESLCTRADAARLIATGGFSAFNVRLAKNGGLIPAIQIARLARQAGVMVQLGCLVGETSILSAAAQWFLRLVPEVRFAECAYGRHLLAGDLCQRPVQFGYAGRLRSPGGCGLGVQVDPARLEQYAVQRPQTIPL